MIEVTKEQNNVLAANGHCLVTGGPGSGKTTISILKAKNIVRESLKPNQHVLFLSFARSSVSRVIEAIGSEESISRQEKHRIRVDTYHAFFWRIIKSHGYLVGLPRRISILLPPNEAVALADIRNSFKPEYKLSENEKLSKRELENKERHRLAFEDGLICFDLFSVISSQVVHGSQKICKLFGTSYPTIILDEFQDTTAEQWEVIQALGINSQLIALADPEQRIYDFIGADPARLKHFAGEFEAKIFDLRDENHRSKGTDIASFGNEILKGHFTKNSYKGISIETFEPNENQAVTTVITQTLMARKRLTKANIKNWSLAILVPTKRMTRLVSEAFRNPIGKLPSIHHEAAIDMEAAVLAAEIIAYVLEQCRTGANMDKFINLICDYYRGKGGGNPTKSALAEATRIFKAYGVANERILSGKSVAKKSIFLPIEAFLNGLHQISLCGNPDTDWIEIRKKLESSGCSRLKEIAIEARNVRLLDRGTQLRDSLSRNWREAGGYSEALSIVRESFTREHFSTTSRPESGVVIMNMHKAKAKQFDEVIIFEGWPRYAGNKIVNPDRIVRSNLKSNIDSQARHNFRVSVTRSKQQTTILTPRSDACVILTA